MKKTYLSEKGSKTEREEKRMISRKMDGFIYNAMSVSLEDMKHQVRQRSEVGSYRIGPVRPNW